MTTVLITYDVDDVQAWLASPTRTATFESAGFTVRPFVDPTVANQVALLVERRKPAAGTRHPRGAVPPRSRSPRGPAAADQLTRGRPSGCGATACARRR